jgi:carboxyl-terminal processing protease
MRTAIVCFLLLSTVPALADDSGHKSADPDKAFREAKQMLLKEYVDNISEEELYRGAIAGMLQAAGKRQWDSLLSPAELGDMHGDLGGQLVGIGMEFDASNDKDQVTVLGTFPGSPAERADLRAGDHLLKVNDMQVKKGNAMDVVRTIRGKVGDKVTLTILRDDKVMVKTLTRDIVRINAVSSMMLPDGNAVIWIRQFGEKTPSLLKENLDSVLARKPHGIVIDLRNNMGGLLDKMVECVGMFLPKGSTIAVELVHGQREEALKTTAEQLVKGLPLAVLANNGTASGAELFAGALRDNLGARIIGQKTVGKWNVQRVAELGNGYAIKYTIGLFKTPKGAQPDGKGLEPDVPVDSDEMSMARAQRIRDAAQRLAADAQLRAAVALMK